jgi:DNA-binding LacI/PurR family transcriptional regulator
VPGGGSLARVKDGGRVTLQTLADALGVSRTTASNAFNRPDQLNPALRERVLALAAELGYAGPDPAGRALRSGRAGAIGVLLTEQLSYAFGDPAAVATLRGLAIEAEQAGISLSLLPVPLSGGAVAAGAVQSALLDACFVYALPEGHASVEGALERRIPVVIADTPHVPGVPFVSIDDRAGARAAAQHLLDLGHRRLAVASLRLREDGRTGLVDGDRRGAATYRVTRERLNGYADAITAAGLDWDAVPIYEGHPNSRALGAEAASALLALDPRPTAILAMSDEIALGVIDAAGRPVPEQLSVVGFDDAPAATPRGLTTVRQPLVEKGRAAGRMLLEALDGGTPADVTLPTELVVRGSTAALG